MATNAQPAILPGAPRAARYLSFQLVPGAEPDAVRDALLALTVNENLVVGLGEPVIAPVVTDAGSGAVPGAAPDRPVPLPPRRPGS